MTRSRLRTEDARPNGNRFVVGPAFANRGATRATVYNLQRPGQKRTDRGAPVTQQGHEPAHARGRFPTVPTHFDATICYCAGHVCGHPERMRAFERGTRAGGRCRDASQEVAHSIAAPPYALPLTRRRRGRWSRPRAEGQHCCRCCPRPCWRCLSPRAMPKSRQQQRGPEG